MAKFASGRGMGVFDVLAAKRAYREGRNVTGLLREQLGVDWNTPEIIEVAYDVQSGAYVEKMKGNPEEGDGYASRLAEILGRWMPDGGSLMDVGTGEITIFSSVLRQLSVRPERVLAFDISWSRIYSGLPYAREHMGGAFSRLTPFVAEMGSIPLPDKSVDVVTSNHALEPNGGTLPILMRELFRVTRHTLVLFEPCFEAGTPLEKERMDRLGYIKGIEEVVAKLGGTMLDMFRMNSVLNALNPTFCFVIALPQDADGGVKKTDHGFSVPGTSYPLSRRDGYLFSNETGLCFPELEGIPVLKPGAAILASALSGTE